MLDISMDDVARFREAVRQSRERQLAIEQDRQRAAEDFAAAVAAARRAGTTVADIADDARITRQAVYELLNKGGGVTYWLKMNGTANDPYRKNDWRKRRDAWWGQYGQVEMLSKRYRMNPGDRLITLGVGSHRAFEKARLFSVLEVLDEAEASPHPQWKWQVPVSVIVDGPLLEDCPTLDDIGKNLRSIRRHSAIRLSPEEGARAERLIKSAVS